MSTLPAARRGLAVAFALCALATLALLANHPMLRGHSLADFIETEASNQLIDALVHGGFIVVLSGLIVCFVLLSRELPARGAAAAGAAAVAGLVCYCIGCGALMLSMVLDGFVIPALSVHFRAAAANDLGAAAGLFVLCGMLIRFLMPMGLLFQAVAMLSWSALIVRDGGWRLAVGAYGLAAAVFMIVAPLTVPPQLSEHLLLGGIVLQSLWYLALAGLLWGRSPPAAAA